MCPRILTRCQGPNRQESTITQTLVFTITPSPTPSPIAGNHTISGNSTVSGNATTTSPLPTAPTNINGGGNGGPNGGAPLPGATGGGGGKVYGPGDGYVAAANALKRNIAVVGLVGCIVGGGLVVF